MYFHLWLRIIDRYPWQLALVLVQLINEENFLNTQTQEEFYEISARL